ncbi:MAG: LLM class flavin-dependent oxidoreductase [Ilumatobacter sp.]|uniref:LLM class flavin-dependent oxidoreductase n=1 Tax=Ilumatobacter sp. TaxID=1967498 RepID=UPI0026267FF6|nr:LLM class flavin-dependent oxidoreductase [Ilumatobacter sp.]MDJ0768735.1 LLM class flavin-dependent oxidoreductase [Ilumatobacter sp.]
MTVLDIQLSPGNTDWASYRDAVLAAEAAGFGAVWVFDHLAGVALGGTSMLETFASLGALAEATTQVELGVLVANVWNRQVGTLVAAAASVALVAGRQVHLGLGAGASPTSAWATEQRAVGADLEPDLDTRHARVVDVLELSAQQWSDDRDEQFDTFPLPTPPPTRIVGVNSRRLSRIAGRHADGINVRWTDPSRDDYLAAADAEAGDRPFLRTAYALFDEELLDPDHPERTAMTARGIDRLILAVLGPPPSF